jgi:hypothetical protein
MPVTPIPRLCTLSTDNDLLASVESAANQVGLSYHAASACDGCPTPCASVVALDLTSPNYAALISGVPRDRKKALMGILPSTMSIETPKQHGIEVIVYRELMQRFLPTAMELALLLLDGRQRNNESFSARTNVERPT